VTTGRIHIEICIFRYDTYSTASGFDWGKNTVWSLGYYHWLIIIKEDFLCSRWIIISGNNHLYHFFINSPKFTFIFHSYYIFFILLLWFL